MKYLGVFIDSRWSFEDHFSYVADKVSKVTRALGRLMPNLRGPREDKRNLYSKEEGVRGGVCAKGDWSRDAAAVIRETEQLVLYHEWAKYLRKPSLWGKRTVEAIYPHLIKWIERRHLCINYYMSQLLTGHGSFGHYLLRIGKRDDESCPHCDSDSDTVEHTLGACPAWAEMRTRLINKIGPIEVGGTLTLRFVVGAILKSGKNWSAFSDFAANVIKAKEEAERNRDRLSPSPHPPTDSSG
ncbi:reverse transcriptase [Lasius niger]|uniref:Reverse transcriptase n=1 Tax=Lasius niger TaxID=67767 RepID=A0A0J7KIQ5_LASNI|nr:reverse transcriptase [Lasius niger]